MATYQAEATQEINARPEHVYAMLSDYKIHHPNIVPKPYFQNIVVQEGGVGAGTVFTMDLVIMGVTRKYRLTVSEPEPGWVLAESDESLGQTSWFILEPLDGGVRTRLTIRSKAAASPGIMGLIERVSSPSTMRRLFRQELANIAEYMPTYLAENK